MGDFQLTSNTSYGYPVWQLKDGQHNVTKYIMSYIDNGETDRLWIITSDYGKFIRPNALSGIPFSNDEAGVNATSPTQSHVWFFDSLPYQKGVEMVVDASIKVTETACNGELFFTALILYILLLYIQLLLNRCLSFIFGVSLKGSMLSSLFE